MDENQKLLRERVNYRILLLLVPLAAAGAGFLFWSQFAEGWQHPIRAVVLREIGVFLFVTGALTILWDVIGKRAFTDEILAKANMSRDLADAGIEVFTGDFKDQRIDWPELFKCGNRLDLFVSYASTWRNNHLSYIEKFLARKGAHIRVILSDPDNEELLGVLSTRFGKEKAFLKQQIEESIKFWQDRNSDSNSAKDSKDVPGTATVPDNKKDAIDGTAPVAEAKDTAEHKNQVEVYLTDIAPFFTFYLFNTKAVAAFYNHRRGRIPVPAFVCDEDGYMFRYLTAEFEGILGNAKPAKPPNIQR
jgi:hypothetical protein